MFEAIRTSLTEWRDYVAWAPDGLVGTAMLALAALLALVIHSVLIRLLLRMLRERCLQKGPITHSVCEFFKYQPENICDFGLRMPQNQSLETGDQFAKVRRWQTFLRL